MHPKQFLLLLLLLVLPLLFVQVVAYMLVAKILA
jgi:hypothetical protein